MVKKLIFLPNPYHRYYSPKNRWF